MLKYLILLLFLSLACKNPTVNVDTENEKDKLTLSTPRYEAISLLGDTLKANPSSDKLLARLEEKKRKYEEDPENIDNIIWYGRFMAYSMCYRNAIEIYSHGIEKYPDDARLYRHRGHRYISIREFDKAITDLTRAAELIEGTENEIEPDGMPNAQNIPVSTLHGNIYYHLGLAYYLDRNMPQALNWYKKCLETSNNPDNVVSATHWIYMILRRMAREETAAVYLRNIKPEMDVIENFSYHKACLFYKGELTLEDLGLDGAEVSSSNTALNYAVANWYYYNEDRVKAGELLTEIVEQSDWSSFGYIAAESDLEKLF